MVENIREIHYEYEDEKPPCHREYKIKKYLQQTLNSLNDFLLLILMLYAG